jgi:hypothetical protein
MMSGSFTSLAGLEPGLSRLSHATSRFGIPATTENSAGELCCEFEAHGIRIHIDRSRREDSDPILEDVHVEAPCMEALPCGVYIGQKKASAIAILKHAYQIHDEYEDSIYFRPCERDDLLAAAEFWDKDVIVSFELIWYETPP